jgi:hypothetical protein
MKPNNYVKLYVRNALLIDADCVAKSTWVFPFGGDGKAALRAAQEQRANLRNLFPELSAEAFQLSTFAPSSLRGVPVVGEVIRALEIVEAA